VQEMIPLTYTFSLAGWYSLVIILLTNLTYHSQFNLRECAFVVIFKQDENSLFHHTANDTPDKIEKKTLAKTVSLHGNLPI
jgi:hypothetical protein